LFLSQNRDNSSSCHHSFDVPSLPLRWPTYTM
jgi:hypothetical protein